ncbi:hypothetical protein ACK828_004858, partial [Salmonella enterica]
AYTVFNREKMRRRELKLVDFKGQPCSLAALQPCSLAALQPCSLAGYANINNPDFQSVFPPDVNFNEEKSSVCRYRRSIPPAK